MDEYETEQQVNAQYVEEFAMLTSEKVSYHRNMKKLMQGPTERQLDRKTQAVEAGGGGGGNSHMKGVGMLVGNFKLNP